LTEKGFSEVALYSPFQHWVLLSTKKGNNTLKIITFDRFKPGVTMETITPLLPEEAANAWRLWKAGIIREKYARADEPRAS
jgi:hypothetical protein